MQPKRCIHNQTYMNFREHGTAQSRTLHLYTRLKIRDFLWIIQSVSRILRLVQSKPYRNVPRRNACARRRTPPSA
nr:MAG TPA: hypothetical protein [Bacteriophage sp.]